MEEATTPELSGAEALATNALLWPFWVGAGTFGVCVCGVSVAVIICVTKKRRPHHGDDEHVIKQMEMPPVPDAQQRIKDVQAVQTGVSEQEQKYQNKNNDDQNDSVELQLEGGRNAYVAQSESHVDPNRNYKPEGDPAS
eukprot:CAMPEP_0202711586 /NCGR_PEP_ID=MMETSP1385-20130828/23348_1 /ASSEMBLY_ACC=CAM_ASM_000861 /TAXON_ID=933848 /ORGANISM="Elphidium margaritaceum" /LENGTH=138 /DNA_ID=CAMNT_0049371339 /DNA_START=96 /DNA_END=509 /DNA_ORIENTATION=+